MQPSGKYVQILGDLGEILKTLGSSREGLWGSIVSVKEESEEILYRLLIDYKEIPDKL